MPAPRRIARLEQLILEVAAEAVQRELSDPRIGFVTLTRVRLASDLTEATVYWSALGTESQRRTSARALADATPVVQSIVAKALATRVTPTLTFRFDPSLERAQRLEDIFERLKHEGGAKGGAAAPSGPEGGEGEAPGRADAGDDEEGEGA